jgi:glycine/D-amino acid oxidase-like deaminating enzyme
VVYGGAATAAGQRKAHFAGRPRGCCGCSAAEGIRFTHAWGGPIDQTPTFVPFYRTLPPGNIHAGLGYSGHGVIQTFVGGHILASTVLDETDEWSTLAVNRPESAS